MLDPKYLAIIGVVFFICLSVLVVVLKHHLHSSKAAYIEVDNRKFPVFEYKPSFKDMTARETFLDYDVQLLTFKFENKWLFDPSKCDAALQKLLRSAYTLDVIRKERLQKHQ